MKKKRYGVLAAVLILIFTLFLSACQAVGNSSASGKADMEAAASYDYGGYDEGVYSDYSEDAFVSEEYAPKEEYDTAEITGDAGSGLAANAAENNPSAKMVYTANVQLQTLEYEKSLEEILSKIKSAGGFIESQEESNNNYDWYGKGVSGNDRYASITARIPSEGLDSFVDGLKDNGQIMSKSVFAENITQRYYDTEASVKALEIEQERLLAMMEKAETIEDMIAVESRLTEVERSLSSYKTDLSYMDKSVEFSTVYIYLDEVKEYSEEPPEPFGKKIAYSIRDSWKVFVSGMQDVLIAIVYILPFAAVIAVLAAVVILIVKKIRKKHPKRTGKKRAKFNAKQAPPETETPVEKQDESLKE